MTERLGLDSTDLEVPPELALETLQMALEGTATGAWMWEVEHDRVRWSSNQGPLHGTTRGAAPRTYAEWLAGVHDDDRAHVQSIVEHALTSGGPYECEYRVANSDPPRWVHARGHVVRHENGRPRAVVGLTLDVTDRHLRDAEREQLTRRLHGLQAVTDVALAHLELESLLDELLARVADLLDADIAKILLYDDRRTVLTTRAWLGLPDEDALSLRIPSGTGVAGHIAVEGRPMVLSDDALSDAALVHLRQPGRHVAGTPLRLENRTLGVLIVSSLERGYQEEDLLLLELVADRCARAIHQSELYEAARDAALALQRSLLPVELPPVAGLDVAARYVPGQAGTEVGGDWYDLFPLADGRVALVVGDVVGRGLRAAARMGSVRTALRAYALEAASPADALERLDRFVVREEPLEFTTVLIAFLDPVSGTAQVASAGHLPPVVVDDDGARLAEVPADPPLGLAEAPRRQGEVRLGPEATLIAFTDGLVEDRRTGLDVGLRRLCELATAGGASRMMVDRVVDGLVDFDSGDDVVVLAARRVGARLDRTFAADVSAVATARHEVLAFAAANGAHEALLRDVALAVSEACTNVVVHAYRERLGGKSGPGPMHVRAWQDAGRLQVAIADEGCGVRPRGDSPGVGLGLGIIARTTSAFDVRDVPSGGAELLLRFDLR